MEKYTDEELKKIKEIMQESSIESLKELLSYINDSEFTENYLKWLDEEESEEDLNIELISRIFERVPSNNKREFLGEIDRWYIACLYTSELTKEYPECFKYAMESIANDIDIANENGVLEYVFKLTDIRKCCKFFDKYTRNNTKRRS